MASPRIDRLFGAVNIGSSRISAMIAGISDSGEMIVLGSAHRAAQGVKRGYVTDMPAATFAIRDAIEHAEKVARAQVRSVWVGTAGAGLSSDVVQAEIDIGGRRIESDDIDILLAEGKKAIGVGGGAAGASRMVLHAQPAHYTLDGAHGVARPQGLHAERLGVDIHVMLAEGAPLRNITEAVQNAHLTVEAVVGSPMATSYACLTPEERDLGVALVEFGADITTVSVYAGGMLLGLASIPLGSGDITDAIASHFGVKRFQAERLKTVNGSAIASPADHRERVPVNAPGEDINGQLARFADESNRVPRSELVGAITGQLGRIMEDVNKALKGLGFTGQRGQQVVFTGGGAELVGLADYAQAALGKPVRIGRPPALRGLMDTYAKPGFAALSGLVLYAATDPVDIRKVASATQSTTRLSGMGLVSRIYRAALDYF